jgi:hypothetical protein
MRKLILILLLIFLPLINLIFIVGFIVIYSNYKKNIRIHQKNKEIQK